MVKNRIAALASKLLTKMPKVPKTQTSKIGALGSVFNNHPAKGLTPSKLAGILEQAENGDVAAQYQLFEDMEERDTHILSEMNKRRRALNALEHTLEPPPNPSAQEKKITDEVKEWFTELEDWDVTLFDTTDAIGKGFVCQEIDWGRVEKLWLPASIDHVPQSLFMTTPGIRQQILLRTNNPLGEPLQPFGWITHIHKAKSGSIERSALFRTLVWPYLFKNYSVGDLAEFLEIYGIPLRVGKYNSGASEKEKLTLLRALMAIGHRAGGIIPQGMELEFHDAARGDAKAFDLMMSWCDKAQSKAILGGTLTSQADGKSSTNALGNVHEEVRQELRDGDARQIQRTITRDLIYPMAFLNGRVDNIRRCPRFQFDLSEVEDISIYATALPPLVDMGFKVPIDWAQRRVGIPQPDGDEPILQKAAAAEPPTTSDQNNPKAALRGKMPNVLPPVDMQGRLAKNLDTPTSAWLTHIRQLADSAESLEQLRELLLQQYPKMTIDEYAAALEEALLTAHLAGRDDVRGGV